MPGNRSGDSQGYRTTNCVWTTVPNPHIWLRDLPTPDRGNEEAEQGVGKMSSRSMEGLVERQSARAFRDRIVGKNDEGEGDTLALGSLGIRKAPTPPETDRAADLGRALRHRGCDPQLDRRPHPVGELQRSRRSGVRPRSGTRILGREPKRWGCSGGQHHRRGIGRNVCRSHGR